MNVIEFLLEAKNLHVFVNREGGQLKVKGNREALLPELKQRLAEYKNEIIDLYGSLDISSNSQLAPTTFSQQRLWFIDQLEGNSIHYNMPSAVRLRGDICPEAIERAMNSLLERHESLRTTFSSMDNEPYQIIHEHEDINVPLRDLSQLEETVQEQDLSRICQEEANKPFALDRDRMMRWQLLKLSENNHVLLRTFHHIASDGWSLGVLTRELSALYKAFLNGGKSPLPPLAIQYADYAHWQRQWLKGEVLETQLKHWTEKLEGIPSVHRLPLDRPRPMVQSYRGHTIVSRVSNELFEAFNKLCFQQGATLFMGLHAVFSLLLSRYSGETDIVVGTAIANREQPDVAPLCGFFLNTLVFRSRLDTVDNFIELIEQSKRTAWDAYEHQQVPFEQLATVLDLEHTLSYAPVFQIMLILQNNDNGVSGSDGLVMEPINPGFEVAKFDITLNATQVADDLILGWNYATDLFDTPTIGRMAANFEILLRSVVAAPEDDLMTLRLIGEVEYKHCTTIWNNTAIKYDRERCIHELFEDRVVESATAIALVSREGYFTYGKINEDANRLAGYLVSEGVDANVLVGVCLPRSVDMVVAVLAIIKAGGAYLPIDPEYPRHHIDHICRDAEPDLLVCHEALSFVTERDGRTICLDSPALQALLEQRPIDNATPRRRGLSAAGRAYVIYTLGSAGLPKGVIVSHRNLHAYYTAARANYGVSPADRVLQFSAFSFDIVVEEMFVALLSGATLVLRPESVLAGGRYFWNFVSEQALTMISLPTAFWHQLCAQLDDKSLITKALRLVIVGGGPMSEAMLSRWRRAVGNRVRLLNTYGPTETTGVNVKSGVRATRFRRLSC